jgi:hypothetical protein
MLKMEDPLWYTDRIICHITIPAETDSFCAFRFLKATEIELQIFIVEVNGRYSYSYL